MELKKVDKLLHKLNFVASYQGYLTTVYLIGQAVDHINQIPRPTLLQLCSVTGEYFNVKPSHVSDNLQTMLKNYCNYEENLERFQEVIGYRVDEKLTNKEFLYEVAAYLARHK